MSFTPCSINQGAWGSWLLVGVDVVRGVGARPLPGTAARGGAPLLGPGSIIKTRQTDISRQTSAAECRKPSCRGRPPAAGAKGWGQTTIHDEKVYLKLQPRSATEMGRTPMTQQIKDTNYT